MSDKNIRKKLFIDPAFQGYFFIATSVLASVGSAIIFAVTRFFSSNFIFEAKKLGLPSDHPFFQLIESQQKMMDLGVFISSVAVFGILIIYGLYMSNRVAGPIYRLKNHLRAYCGGKEYSKVTFREKDFFPELATLVNDAILHAETRSNSSTEKKS